MSLKVKYKIENQLIKKLLDSNKVQELKSPSLLDKLTFKSTEYPDIYFHFGSLDEESIQIINNSKIVVANCYTQKEEILKNCNINYEQIEVIYPTINYEYINPKIAKKSLCEKFDIDKKKRIILFHSKNLKKNGVMEFLDIIKDISNDNFHGIIAGDQAQIYSLKFKFTKYNLDDKVTLLEDYENINELYAASDIYILPTYLKPLNSNVIKAMFFKTAVFVSSNNNARELIDVFSTMDSPNDRSMQFKVNALLNNKDELKKIKKENKKLSEEFLFDLQLQRVTTILEKLS